MSDSRVLPFAPWHRPRERYLGAGVYVTDVYGDHVLAALLHAAWRWLRPGCPPPESSQGAE